MSDNSGTPPGADRPPAHGSSAGRWTGVVRRHRPWLAVAVIGSLAAGWWLTGASPRGGPAPARPLVSGLELDGRLAAGATQSFAIDLQSGDYAGVAVEQGAYDLIVAVSAPGAHPLGEVDGRIRGVENVSIVAERSGRYGLDVTSAEKLAGAVVYTIRLIELRRARPDDAARVAAERSVARGRRLARVGSETSMEGALREYEQALVSWHTLADRSSEAATLHAMGVLRHRLDQNTAAVDLLRRAVDLRRALGERTAEAESLNDLGLTLDDLGEKAQAQQLFNQALPLWRAAGDPRGEAETLGNLGAIALSLGQYAEATAYFNRILPTLRLVGDKAAEGAALTNLGGVHDMRGEPQQAQDYFERALALVQESGDRATEGLLLLNLGGMRNDRGEKQEALDFFARARAILHDVGDRTGEAHVLNQMGTIYADLDDLPRALDLYRQALTDLDAAGNQFGAVAVLNNIGSLYNVRGERRESLEWYGAALKRSRQIKDQVVEGYALQNLGSVHTELGDYDQAQSLLRESLALRRTTHDRKGEAQSLQQLGILETRRGRRSGALAYHRRARQMFRDLGQREGEAEALHAMARLERDRGDLVTARASMELAVQLVESLRRLVGSTDLRASYLASMTRYYETYIDILMRLQVRQPHARHAEAALDISERRRARGLLETLAEARVDISAGVDATLLKEQRQAQQQLNAKAAAVEMLVAGAHDAAAVAAARKELAALLARDEEIGITIRQRSPRYGALAEPQPLGAAAIQREVLDGDTLLLEYALGDERSHLWAVSVSGVRSVTLPPRATVESAARRVYELLTTGPRPSGDSAAEERSYWQAARVLSDMVLGPVGPLLNGKRLLIVADGALQYIPFGALPVPGHAASTNVPLIETHEIVTAPSASVLAVLKREREGRSPAPRSVAVLADPVFDADDARVAVAAAARGQEPPAAEPVVLRSARQVGALDRGGATFPRLLFSRREANAVAALSADSFTALDFRATRQRAMSEELRQYRVLHFATHGLLNTEHPQLSGLVLSLVDEHGAPQDGFLRLHDIYNLRLDADLVVLSACQTGLGRDVKGEGLVGLTRGFMYAGAPRVAVSLWRIDDEATAFLMRAFYTAMLTGRHLRPAEALRAAQIATRREARWQSPYYWASFVLQGMWQ